MWEVKKIQDFCPRDIKSCHLAAARRVKPWIIKRLDWKLVIMWGVSGSRIG